MLVTDPLGTQAAAVAGLYSRNGRVELLQRAGSMKTTKVRVSASPRAWTFIRPVDRKWRLESINWYGRIESVRGRGCDAYGLPVTSRTLLASLDAFVVGPAQQKAAPFAQIRWFDGQGTAATSGTITTTSTFRVSGSGVGTSGGSLLTRQVLRISMAGIAGSAGSAALRQTWTVNVNGGVSSSAGSADATLGHGVTHQLAAAGSASSGGAVAMTQLAAFYTFEGGVDEDGVGISDPDPSGYFWDDNTNGTGTSRVFDTARAKRGTRSMRISSSGTAARNSTEWWAQLTATSAVGPFWARAYLYIPSGWSVSPNIVSFQGASTNRAAVRFSNDGLVRLVVNGATTADVSTNSFPVATWFRVELQATGSTGSQALRFYDANENLIEELSATTNSGGLINNFAIGIVGSIANVPAFWVDEVAISRTGWIGPVG